MESTEIKGNKSNHRSISRKYHIVFWLAYFVFNVIRWGSYFDDYWYSFKSNLVEFPLHILLVYFNIYYLIPKFILTKKYKKYILGFALALAILYVVRTGLFYFLINKNIWPEAISPQQSFTFNHIVAVILGEIYVVALATAIKLTVDWVYERKRVEDLKQIQLQTELKFLKSQMQPHFFFNTLNNLYALTIEKSDKAPNLVLKLSDMMQYVLYDVKEAKASLFSEINYIQNYIDIQRLRFENRVISEMSIEGDIDNLKVPSLLFLPFIENAFKHGVQSGGEIQVNTSFKNEENEWLIFTVENAVNKHSKINTVGGVGLKNVRRRLDLLYKNNYSLQTTSSDSKFEIVLKIPIHEN